MARHSPLTLCTSLILLSCSITFSSLMLPTANAFVSRPPIHARTSVNYRTLTENDVETSPTAAPLAVENVFLWEDDELKTINENAPRQNGKSNGSNGHKQPQSTSEMAEQMTPSKNYRDPSVVEFVPSDDFEDQIPHWSAGIDRDTTIDADHDHYPFAAMLQGSAPYIASHLGETAVFYIPGEWLHKPNKLFDSFLQDIALARLLGMKLVLVADCRMEADGSCDDFDHAHECHNSLRATSSEYIRSIEEEAGYIRFEVERKLNRFLKMHLMGDEQDGNVVGGNFYQARAFGTVRGEDFEHTGFVQQVYTDNIQHSLNNNDVVLLTTVGCSPHGDSVNVNGHHLAAAVAASLKAYKLIYMANQGSVLSDTNNNRKFFQEIPLSFTQDLCDYHKVKVHKTGFANFEQARQTLEPRAVELLLNLAWGSWAVDQGVTRAHIVNPKDGALLEELFTSKNGANTCLYHDDELLEDNDDESWLSEEDSDDWNAFFAEAARQEAA